MADKEFKLNREAAKGYLAGDNTYLTTVMAILYATYGDKVYEEDPDILFKDIEDDFGCKLSEENENKINAAIVLMTTDKFFNDQGVFTAVTLAINEGDIGGIPEGKTEEIDGLMVVWAMFEASLLGGETLDWLLGNMSEQVRNFANDQIASIAEDREDIPDNVDTVKEALDSNVFIDYIKRNAFALATQLEAIGANKEALKEFLEDNDIKVEIV